MSKELEFIGSISVLKSGSLYRITIPKDIVIKLGLKQGDKLLVYLDHKNKSIIIRKP